MVTLAPPPHFAQADHRDAFSGPTKEILLKIQEKSTSFPYTSRPRDALSVLRPGLKMVTLAPPPHFAQADQSRAAYLAMTIQSQIMYLFWFCWYSVSAPIIVILPICLTCRFQWLILSLDGQSSPDMFPQTADGHQNRPVLNLSVVSACTLHFAQFKWS